MENGNGGREAAKVRGLATLIVASEAKRVDPTLQAEFQYRIGTV